MVAIEKFRKNYFLAIIFLLGANTFINYSKIPLFNAIGMNDFFSGFIVGALISFSLLGLSHYSKLKK